MRLPAMILMVGVLMAVTCHAQVALLDKVYDLIQSREFVKAREALVSAEKHPTTQHDPRTFYLKAFVFKELFLQSSGEVRERNTDAILSSIETCRRLDIDQSFKKPLGELLDFAKAGIFNEASSRYNNEQYAEAIRLYKRYCKIALPEDQYWLEAKYFVGVAYNELKAVDSAILYLDYAQRRNYAQPVLYVDLTYLYLNNARFDDALATISKGLTLYPDYYDLQIARINTLTKTEQFDTLEIVIESFLRQHPDELDVLLMAGTVYEKKRNEVNVLKYYGKAEKVYQKVLSIDPNNIDANYNLGVLYYNEAVEIVNKNDIDTDIDELTKVLERSTQLFEKALPLLQHIFNSQSKNLKLLHALQAIYYNLNMRQELAEVNDMIKALGKT